MASFSLNPNPRRKKRRPYNSPKLPKEKCEICEYSDNPKAIEVHHIIPRTDPRCHNGNDNLAVVCSRCHSLVHAGEITIIGVYQTTAGRKLMFFREGEEPPIKKEFWKVKENPFVVTLK